MGLGASFNHPDSILGKQKSAREAKFAKNKADAAMKAAKIGPYHPTQGEHHRMMGDHPYNGDE
jgi:hypothetical protein